jgi:zinc transporter ZupT
MILSAILTFISTFLGGLFSLKFKNKLHLILGFTAGVVLGLVVFDLLPEIFEIVHQQNVNPIIPMMALMVGIILLHLAEKTLLIHHSQEGSYKEHKHPSVGVLSALALIGHSFLDGVGIGVGFQISHPVGILVAIAVIGHDFADGLNTGSLMLASRNSTKKTYLMIFFDAIAPVIGAFATLFYKFPQNYLVIYLGFFAGTLLYIGLGDILPEAHSRDSSLKTVAMTVVGIVFIYFVTRLT